MSAAVNAFIALMKHPLKFRWFLFTRLPSAYFAGVRVIDMDENKATISVPYKWFSQNPFRSTYFACLAMAAEMSTGSLAMAYLYKRKPAVSMLVTGLEANYFKKAVGKTIFICEDGPVFASAVEEAISTGEPRMVKAKSTGRNEAGEIVAEFYITWSFKRRKLSNS